MARGSKGTCTTTLTTQGGVIIQTLVGETTMPRVHQAFGEIAEYHHKDHLSRTITAFLHRNEKKSNLEKLMMKFVTSTEMRFQQTDSALRNQQASTHNLESQIGQISKMLSKRQQGALPSTIESNPREHCKAIALQSDKPARKEPMPEVIEADKVEDRQKSPVREYQPPVPYPARLKQEKVDKQFVMDMEGESIVPLILGRPFLVTYRVVIDVCDGKLQLRVDDKTITFDLATTMRHSLDHDDVVFSVDILDDVVALQGDDEELYNEQVLEQLASLLATESSCSTDPFLSLDRSGVEKVKSSFEDHSVLELKELPMHLSYGFLDKAEKLLVIVVADLTLEERKMTLDSLKRINLSFCSHKILMEDSYRPFLGEPYTGCAEERRHDRVCNEKDELIPTRTVTGFRICIDYRRLNYIPIAPEDQEKTTFTCPYGTFAYRRTPVCLCNAPAMFKQWMEVDRAKVETISKLPPPSSVRAVRSFLGHTGFYRRFIRNFSKIARPLTQLLIKEAPFVFDDACLSTFEILKKLLTIAPIMASPDWGLPFKLIYDASDYTVGAVLGQRFDKKFQPIYYASKTLTRA
ncbi:uncharacterized protein LOC125371191 [Ricinus communis]|uniref:uncharacterized protein LOC125371191 n=1 Tax=Ricinus communis TaxID=3988 RepID=UPI00201AB6C5|nr:uncharacterized protein LOC125371191 [Ricinus communis]